jgi:hypothetical protein
MTVYTLMPALHIRKSQPSSRMNFAKAVLYTSSAPSGGLPFPQRVQSGTITTKRPEGNASEQKSGAWPGGNLLRKCALCLLIALAALAAPIAAHADSPAQPIPADGKCAVPVDPNWTKQEQFVWLNVCAGKEVNFNKEPGYGGDLNPKSPAGLPENRILRSSFVEAILLNDKYRRALTRLGVRITGARFTETVDLRNAELQHDLWLDRSLLEKGVDLTTAETSRRITFDGSKILGTFDASGAQINKDLSMDQAELSENVELSAAHIGRLLDLNGSTVTGELHMNSIQVDQSLFMSNKAQFKQIYLRQAHIGGQLVMRSSTVTDVLDMNGIRIDQGLFMDDKAQFKGINLAGAYIGGQLVLNASTVTGMLNMDGIRVDRGMFMRDDAHFTEIKLVAAHIGATLDLGGSTITGKLNGKYIDVGQTIFLGYSSNFTDEIDLTSAKLGQDLDLSFGVFNRDVDLTGTRVDSVLGLAFTQWVGSATLNLTDAAVGEINLSHNWPDKVDLNGLTYRNLSNLAGNFSRELAETRLGKPSYSPQRYEQLASVLQSNGWTEDATRIRYAGKEHERREASGLNWVWLLLLNYTIGFGYHLEFAFYWAVGVVLLGWAVLYYTGQRTKHGITLGLAYSFDMLLPAVQLRKKHYDIDLDPWPRRYFYAHRIIGVILALFLVAGISGLTK